MNLQTVIYALMGGVLPSILWLWFWLREDKKNPEPTYAIVIAFFAGVLAVFISIALEKGAQSLIKSLALPFAGVIIMASWAFIEEISKYLMAWISSLKKPYNDEPIDSLVYMITVALGFAAAENTLFLLDPLTQNQLFESILTGNMRFLGATLLHILASSIVGAGLAISFKRSAKIRRIALLSSLFFAFLVHFGFNYSISELKIGFISVFAYIWIALIALLILFEKIKRIKY